MKVSGAFSNDAVDAQNWFSPPPTQRRPPPMDVKPEWLDALACSFSPSLDAALVAAGIDTKKADPDYALKITVGGPSDVGGHEGGLTIRIDAWSTRHPRDVVYGSSRTELPKTGDDARNTLAWNLDDAIGAAFESLHKSILAFPSKPTAELTLVFETDNLGDAQKEEIDRLARCGVGLDESASSEKIAEYKWRVRYRLEKWEPDETEDQYVEKFASWLGEICAHGKCRCSTWRSKLDGFSSERRVDKEKKTVFVRLVHR